jgi:serine/threonine protein kinase
LNQLLPLKEKPYNQKSDIWSLGCILYEMTTLRHAFDATSMKGLIVKILRGQYPAISNHYSKGLRSIVKEILNKDSKARPSIKRILEKSFLAVFILTSFFLIVFKAKDINIVKKEEAVA